MGVSGPSEALTVLRIEKSAVLAPAVTLASQRTPPRELPAQAPDHRGVLREAAEARREAAREPFLEREAVRVVEDGAEGGRIGHVVAIATVGQPAGPSPRAAGTSPTSRVRPPSPLNTPPRVFGFRK